MENTETIILKGLLWLVAIIIVVRIKLILTVIRLSLLGQFPYFRKIDWSLFSNHIGISTRYGYKDNPEWVEVHEFDVYGNTSEFSTSANTTQVTFQGTLREGLDKICEDRSLFLAVLVYLLKNLTFLLSAGASIFSVLVILWQSQYNDFDPNKASYSTDYPFWWEYTHSFRNFMSISVVCFILLLILSYFSNKWRKSGKRN